MGNELDFVTGAQLARILGVSRATVTNLAADGIALRTADRGAFDLAASVQNYLRRRLEQAKTAKDHVSVQSLTDERSRLTRAKADAAEREARVRAGELVDAGEIEAAWVAVITTARNRLRLVPNKIAPRVATMTAPAEVQALLLKEIDAVLTDIATAPAV